MVLRFPPGVWQGCGISGGIASGIAGRLTVDSLRAFVAGTRPDVAQLRVTSANTLRVTKGLSHLRGAALKMGQMLSLDTGVILPEALTSILGRLRDDARHIPSRQREAMLNVEWGHGWYRRFTRCDARLLLPPLLVMCTVPLRRMGRILRSRFSFRKQASIDSDEDSMAVLMRLPGLLPRGMDIGPMLDEARRQLHAEADYLAEAQNLTRFGAMLQGSDAFALPHLYADLCTLQVLAMTYVESTPLDSLVDAPQQLRDRVATALIDLVLRGLFVFGAMQADPNLANYRYAPATGRFVLLDLGAVQVITPALASDFRALARAALGDDARVTCNAMLRIGYFAGDTAPHYRELIQAMFEAALAQLRQAHAYDFGNSDQLDRLRDMGLAIGHSRALAHVPPAATLFLHRKIGGMYLMAAKRRAQVALRPLVQAYCGTSTPSD